jgi:hypothetical protein
MRPRLPQCGNEIRAGRRQHGVSPSAQFVRRWPIALAKLDWYHRTKDLDPNYATGRFNKAAAPVELGRLDEARAEVQAGLALNPGFTIWRYRAGALSDSSAFLRGRSG